MARNKPILHLITFAMGFSLAGCGTLFGNDGVFSDRSSEYQEAQTTDYLKIPAGVHKPKFEPLHPVPELPEQAQPLAEGKFVLPAPKPLQIVWENERVKLVQNKQKSWLSVNIPPSQAWGLVQNYWHQKKVALVFHDAKKGVMETVWLDASEDAKNMRDSAGSELDLNDDNQIYVKIRVQIERGDFRDMSNIYLSRVQYSVADESDLPNRNSIDWSLIKTFEGVERPLKSLQAYLLQNQKPPQAISLVAQSTSLEQPNELVQRSGLTMLLIRDDFNYSWSSVGEALRRGNFPIEDLNRSQATYYLELRDAEKNRSELLEHFIEKEKVKKRLFGDYKFQVRLLEENENILVSVVNSQGTPAAKEVAEAILKRIKEYLS